MAIEIEKKYRLRPDQRAAIRESLREFGAELCGQDFEENSIYGGGVLNEKKAVLRLRTTQDRVFLTFKQRIDQQSGIKRQIEHETEVKDAAETGNIIASLGFEKFLVYEKRRETWRFRQTEIVLDELSFGSFMEIEGSITAIGEAELLLGAEAFEVEHDTYPRLTAKHGVRRENVIEARFS